VQQGTTTATPTLKPQQRGAFTVTEAGITWRCTKCDTENPLDASACSVCGTRFADALRPPDDRPQRDPNTVAMYSLFFPGAGHWYMGLRGMAVARGIVSTWVLAVGILAAVAGSVMMAAVFGLAAFGLWGVAAHDAYREARGESRMVILKSRMFVYVVLGLLLLMVVMLVTAGLRASR
jgi:ribosomal protein L40E